MLKFISHSMLKKLSALLLALAACFSVYAQTDLPADYICNRQTIFDGDHLAADLNWLPAAGGEVELAQYSNCWMRVAVNPTRTQEAEGFQFIRITQEQGQEIYVYDQAGVLVGSSQQNGENFRLISSQYQAVLSVGQYTPSTLYVNVKSVNPLYNLHASVDMAHGATVISSGEKRDAIAAAMAAFLLTVGVFSAVYAALAKEKDYLWYSMYALLSGVHVFGNYGVSLPFGINTANGASLVAEPAANIVLVWTVLRLGKFAQHSPWCGYALHLIIWLAGFQVLWLSLMLIGLIAPSSLSNWYYFFQYGASNVLSLAIVWGGLNGWRKGVKIGLPLALGTAPRAVLWMAHSETINQVIFGGWPSGFGFTEPAGIVGLLALPALFLLGIAVRSRDMQREVVRLARMDQLTGLPNRDRIIQLGDSELKRGTDLTLLVVFVERFKAINDVLGYEAGDAVMIQVSQRLAHIEGATVGRNLGTQFCLLWPFPDRLEKLRGLLEQAFSKPVDVFDHLLDVTLSVGVATNTGDSAAKMMRNAEVALDISKQTKVGWLQYERLMETSRPENLSLLSEINVAIERGQLQLFLQPKVQMSDGDVHSAEALIRWIHPVKGMVPPSDFIPFAEQTGKIRAITYWILAEAAKLTRSMRERGQPLMISVNISTQDLRDKEFVRKVADLMGGVGAQPEDIRLEVTESGVMDDPETSLVTLHALRTAGFTLSIDDFGTGYSSLSYLQKMPVSEIKIDRSFVRNVRKGTEGAALLDSIVALGHRLGLRVVAEGAESHDEWLLLSELGCDYLQGWYAAKAMPVEEFVSWRAVNRPFCPPG